MPTLLRLLRLFGPGPQPEPSQDLQLERFLLSMDERNKLRTKEAIAQMGTLYVCHPDNKVQAHGARRILP